MQLVSEEKVEKLGPELEGEWIDGACRRRSSFDGVGPIMIIVDIDLEEANEAFAAQSIAVQK